MVNYILNANIHKALKWYSFFFLFVACSFVHHRPIKTKTKKHKKNKKKINKSRKVCVGNLWFAVVTMNMLKLNSKLNKKSKKVELLLLRFSQTYIFVFIFVLFFFILLLVCQSIKNTAQLPQITQKNFITSHWCTHGYNSVEKRKFLLRQVCFLFWKLCFVIIFTLFFFYLCMNTK